MSDAGRDHASTVPSPTGAWRDLSGKVLGDFRLIRKLGEGGMGQVYLAEQISLRRRVAVKLLKGDLAAQEVSLKRFRAEAKTVAQLNHPNIVQVYAFGESEGVHYMAMEFVDGRNLRDYLRRNGPAPVGLVLHVLQQVALALQRAAELGLVHRDIKPENLLVTRRGEVKVADFGLSRVIHGEEAQRMTQTGTTLGTPLYMSPEQVEGRPLDCRSDIYSLGVTCYHLLAGRPPFEGENAFAVALQHVQQEPTPLKSLRPDLPDDVCALVHRMMAKRPEDRFASPAELLQAVSVLQQRYRQSSPSTTAAESATSGTAPAIGGSGTVPTEPVSASASTLSWPRRDTHRSVRRWLWALGVPVSLLLAFTLGLQLSRLTWQDQSGVRVSAAGTIEDNPSTADGTGAESSTPRSAPSITTRDQEEALQVLVRVSERPEKDPVRLRQGVQHRIDLLVLLLRHYGEDRTALDRAEKWCRDWMHSPVEAYAFVGEIGLAMVLAFRDQPAQSNELFVNALKRCPGLQRPAYGMTSFLQPEWYRLVVRALEHNRINAAALGLPFPTELARLRQELPARPRPLQPPA